VHEDERKRERWIEKRADRRVYINKPREKTPKIIPAREEINPWIPGCAQGKKRCVRAAGRVVPKRRLTGWVLGSKLN